MIHTYYEIKAGHLPAVPLVSIFGAKAAPAYIIAKDIIHALLTLSKVVAADPEVSKWLQIVFIENYNVTACLLYTSVPDKSFVLLQIRRIQPFLYFYFCFVRLGTFVNLKKVFKRTIFVNSPQWKQSADARAESVNRAAPILICLLYTSGTFDICISLLNVYHKGIITHRFSQCIGNHFAIHPQESAF